MKWTKSNTKCFHIDIISLIYIQKSTSLRTATTAGDEITSQTHVDIDGDIKF